MFSNYLKYLLLFFTIPLSNCTQKSNNAAPTDAYTAISRDLPTLSKEKDTIGLETATLAGGCFWKMDACYQQVKGIFYKAEEYHQDYYNEHPWEPYNLSVVRPKVKHFEEVFKGKMK